MDLVNVDIDKLIPYVNNSRTHSDEQIAQVAASIQEFGFTNPVLIDEKYSIIVRDATIQRFEYTFEAFWKFVKEFLREREGIVCNSPKKCFRELFSIGEVIEEEEATKLLEMVDDRNMTSHTYKEEVAQILFSKINGYYNLMQKTVTKLDMLMNI